MDEDSSEAGLSVCRAGLGAVAVGQRIFLLGGHSGSTALKIMASFEPALGITRNGRWLELPPMHARRSYLAAVELGGHIFAIGGGADSRMLNTVEAFDVEKSEWILWYTLPPMQSKRMQHAAVAAGDKIFVCGGFDGRRDMATVECFNPTLNQWSWMDSMSTRRSYLGMAVAEKHIYAIGGQDRLSGTARAHATVEAFDLHSERWYERPPLSVPRIAPAVVSVVSRTGEEFIYVCGGSNESEVLASVERFDVKRGKWTELPPMNTPRLSHAAVVFKHRMFVFGGSDGEGPLDTFEVFDLHKHLWGPSLKLGQFEQDLKAAEEEEQEAAATKIQAIHRGNMSRRQ